VAGKRNAEIGKSLRNLRLGFLGYCAVNCDAHLTKRDEATGTP
jgi:hypothetical protein